jgi:putative sigma-54 modulation protein
VKVILTGRNLELTPSLKDFVEKKMDSIRAFVEHLQEIDVTLSVDKTKSQGVLHTAEVTVWAKGINFRASQSHPDMYAAIDLIIDKLQKQITKYKDKMKGRSNHKSRNRRGEGNFKHHVFRFEDLPQPEEVEVAPPEPEIIEDDNDVQIIRSNQFESKPMYIDEAAEQLQYLQQEFVVFNNAETGQVNVVYRRNDGNIGLIEPQ